MKNAVMSIVYLSVIIGVVLTVITTWFALGFILRILGFLCAVVGVICILAYVAWSWWTECVVEPYRAKKQKKRGR